jgi:hypothetical protein
VVTHARKAQAGNLSDDLFARRSRREEFRRHRNANEQFLVGFEREWRSYVETLRDQEAAAVGADLPADVLLAMTDEQRAQLHKLKDQAAAGPFEGRSAKS